MECLSLVLGILVQLIAQSAAVPDKGPQQQPTFKAGVELVTIDAIVVDKSGHPNRLRVVASDANGYIGSVEKPISAALARAGSYASSDLLTACTDALGISKLVTLDTLPHDVRTLIVRLELYPESAGTNAVLQVRFQLLQSDTSAVIAAEQVTPSVSDSTRVATATLPIQELNAGSYIIRATVFENGSEVRMQSATFKRDAR